MTTKPDDKALPQFRVRCNCTDCSEHRLNVVWLKDHLEAAEAALRAALKKMSTIRPVIERSPSKDGGALADILDAWAALRAALKRGGF